MLVPLSTTSDTWPWYIRWPSLMVDFSSWIYQKRIGWNHFMEIFWRSDWELILLYLVWKQTTNRILFLKMSGNTLLKRLTSLNLKTLRQDWKWSSRDKICYVIHIEFFLFLTARQQSWHFEKRATIGTIGSWKFSRFFQRIK